MLNWLRRLLSWLASHLFSTASGFIESETGVYEVFADIEGDVLNAKAAIQAEIEFWRNIRIEGPSGRWKTRVISVPSAIEHIKDLVDELLHGIHDRVTAIHDSVLTLKNVIHPPGPPHEQEGAEAQAGVLANAQAWLATVKLAMVDLKDTVHQASDLIQFLHDLRVRITNLDDIFLSQGTSRKVVDVHYRKRYVR